MTHWRSPHDIPPTPQMVLWRRVSFMISGLLIGGGLAMLVWGLK